MRVLLGENLPRQLREALAGLDVATVAGLGWKGAADGELLGRAEGEFDVLVTADRSLLRQQNLAGRSLAVLVLPTNRRREVLALAPALRSALADARPGRHAVLGRDGRPVPAN